MPLIHLRVSHLEHGSLISTLRIRHLAERLESLEHYLNQQSILVDTLMKLITETSEELKQNDTQESNMRSLGRNL